MPRLTRPLATVWRREPGAGRGFMLATLLTLVQGFVLLLGGPSRTSTPSYAAVLALGGPGWFGLALVLIGLALVVGSFWSAMAVRTALMLDAVAHFLLGFSFLFAALIDDRAGFLGPVIYIGIGAWLVSQREMYR